MSGIDIRVEEVNKRRAHKDTYYQAYKWYRDYVGWILREEWFTWDGRSADLIAFKERLLNEDQSSNTMDA